MCHRYAFIYFSPPDCDRYWELVVHTFQIIFTPREKLKATFIYLCVITFVPHVSSINDTFVPHFSSVSDTQDSVTEL